MSITRETVCAIHKWWPVRYDQLAIYSWRTCESCLRRTCRRNFYRVTLCIMHSSYRIFLTCHISETARDRNILPLDRKSWNYVLYPMAPLLMTLDDPQTNIPNFYRATLCYVMALRCSVRLARGRGTRVATSSSMRPTATDAQQWRGLTTHADYCYWGCGRTTGWPTCFSSSKYCDTILK